MTTKSTDTWRSFLGTIIFLKLIPSIYFMIYRCYIKLSAQYLPLCNICNLLGRCDILFWQNWKTCIKWTSYWENLFCICENKRAGNHAADQRLYFSLLSTISLIVQLMTIKVSRWMPMQKYIYTLYLDAYSNTSKTTKHTPRSGRVCVLIDLRLC